MAMDQWLTTMGNIAAGSLQGRQMAEQENDAESQRREQQGLQIAPMLANLGQQQHEAALDPYKVLAPHIGLMAPGAQADFLTRYSQAAGQPTPGPDWNSIAGTFDKDSPIRAMLQRMGGTQQPAPLAPGAYPYGLPRDVAQAAPGGVPGAGVMPASAPGAVPGAPVGGPQRPVVTGPGGAQFALGPDQKQITAARSEVARIAPRFGGKDLPPDFRAQAQTAIARASQQIESGDLEGAHQTIAQLHGLEMDIPRQTAAGGQARYTGIARRYDAQWQQFQQRALPGDAAYSSIHALREFENQAEELAKEHPELAVGVDHLKPYGPQIDAIDKQFQEAMALRTKPKRTPEEDRHLANLDSQWRGAAQDLHDQMRWGQTESQHATTVGRALTTMRQYINQLPPSQRDPETIAEMMEKGLFGGTPMPAEARYIREHGLNFGGAEAEKQTVSLLKGLPQFMRPGTPDAVRKAFANQILAQSTLTGHPIKLDPAQLVRPSLKDIKGTAENRAANDAHLKSFEELKRLQAANAVDIPGGKWLLDLQIKGAKRDQALGLFDPALARSVAIHRMSAAQHDTNAASALYSKWLSANTKNLTDAFDPDFYLKQTPEYRKGHPLDEIAAKGVRLYADWKAKDAAAQSLFDRIPKEQAAAARARVQGTPTGTGRGAIGSSQKPLTPQDLQGMSTADLFKRLAQKHAGG